MYVADYRRDPNAAPGSETVSFVECQDNMVKKLKDIARGAQDMVSHI